MYELLLKLLAPDGEGGSGAASGGEGGGERIAGEQGAAGGEQVGGEQVGGEQVGAGSGTIAGGAGEGEQAGYWPSDWRDRLANGDERMRRNLERYTDPTSIWQKVVNQEKLISQRQESAVSFEPEAGMSDADLAKWREDRGIPASPDGYLENIKLSGNRVIGEADLPKARAFAEEMHAVNAPQAFVDKAVDAYLNMNEAFLAKQAMDDEVFRERNRDMMRDRWGDGDMRVNIDMIRKIVPAEEFELIMGGRTADGQVIGNDARMLGMFADMARQMLGDEPTIYQDGSPASSQGIEQEIAHLESLSAKQDSEYWHGPNAERLQNRLAELLEAQEKLQARA